MLDDVVVIGYGTQAKSHLTGSISKLEGEKLINAPVSDVTTALQGAMTGLTVSNETSEVGVTPSIRVRGTGSISADSEPLVIIDGFPVSGGLSSINAADVKSIEILKDAASAAIYGSRSSNGVVLVTTKKGKKNQRATVRLSGMMGWQNPDILFSPVKGYQNATLRNLAATNAGEAPLYTPDQIRDLAALKMKKAGF